MQIRKDIVNMFLHSGSGHPGGSFSIVEILTVLFFNTMVHDSQKPKWSERDRFILSKGHAAPALYATLAHSGYFSVEELVTLRKMGSRLQGHPDMRRLECLEMSSGSLGLGLSVAVGMALAGKIDNKRYRVYALLGDGEIQEGQIWEAAMASSHYRLNNLTVILDRNGLQLDGATEEILSIEPIALKWKAFGWNVIEISGFNIIEIIDAFRNAKQETNSPTILIAHTIKGKGIPIMEWNAKFHGKLPNKVQLKKILDTLSVDEI